LGVKAESGALGAHQSVVIWDGEMRQERPLSLDRTAEVQ
jgi:hypothetical protein